MMGIAMIYIAALVVVVILIRVRMVWGERGHYAHMEAFLENERKANEVRRKDIDPAVFVVADLAGLPLATPSTHEQQVVEVCAGRQMIRFQTPMTNQDIKFAFGTANFEVVVQYEANFEQLMNALANWAYALVEHGEGAKARVVLTYAIGMGCDFAKCHQLLVTLESEAEAAEEEDITQDITEE